MKWHKIHQKLHENPLDDIAGEVCKQLDSSDLPIKPGQRIALTAGSRGIDRIPKVLQAVGNWLKSQGALPFLVPCMGSHNGATAEGQAAMLHTLGINPESTGLDIQASMDTVQIGSVSKGPVFMDRFCYEADGVLVINRIKLHTAFSGPLQSGLSKMMVVGMGKIESARTFHAFHPHEMCEALASMAQCILDSGKILGALALLEDGLDHLAEIHFLSPQQILKQEPDLVQRHRQYFPSLPLDDLNVLVVQGIGKNLSGTGMDTNVIGRRGIPGAEDLERPAIQHIAALSLHPDSQGNALGIGLADACTQALLDDMDEAKTLTNARTTRAMERIRIPEVYANDEALFAGLQSKAGTQGWMIIPNTLHLDTLYASEDLAAELNALPACRVVGEAFELNFENGVLI